MGDSADTAREKLAAKRVPKRKKPVLGPPVPTFKPSADARAFGASTAIFVPPELQHEGPKAPPRSIMLPKPRPETVPQKRKRQAQETQARERMRVGLKISSPTGKNRLDAVPVYHTPAQQHTLDMLAHPPGPVLMNARGLLNWKRSVINSSHLSAAEKRQLLGEATTQFHTPGASPGSILRGLGSGIEEAIRPISSLLIPNPGGLDPRRAPAEITPADVKRKYEAASDAALGKSVTNLLFNLDVPNTKGQAAGLGVGILGILPIGRLTQLAKIGRAAATAGRIGEALPDSVARTAAKAAIMQRFAGHVDQATAEEQTNKVMLLLDNAARNTAKKGEDPLQFYERNRITATNYADFAKTPGAKTALFQTEPGNRYGIVEGAPGRGAMQPLTPRAAFGAASLGEEVHFMTDTGDYAILSKRGEDFTLTVTDDASNEISHETVTASWAREALRDSPVVPFRHLDEGTKEVPVFRADLPTEVAKLQTKTASVDGRPTEVFVHSKEQLENSLRNAVKPAEWEDSGMKDFFDQYPKNSMIPKAALDSHLSTSLNAYDLDETVRASPSLDFPTRFGSRGDYEGLTVREDSLNEPYYEITMSLRTPLHTQVRRSIMGGHPRVNAPYTGKGASHWRGETDVVAHVRFHIITDAEGKKALLVDEIQSDWASEWRKLKAMGGHAGVRARVEEITKQINDLEREVADRHLSPDEYIHEPGDVYEIESQIDNLLGEKQDLQAFENQVPGPPPLGQKQVDAAVRRTLRFAHDANVDRIIIVGGDVQSLRNVAYRTTPKGKVINLHDFGRTYEQRQAEMQAWQEGFQGMSPAEIKDWLNWSGHAEASPMVKTFRRLYGTAEKPRGEIAATFEKEMGEQGGIKQGIFKGGYADMLGAVQRDVNGTAMDGYVIEMTPAAKAKAAAPMRYYQTAVDPSQLPNGAAELFADGTRVIHLFEGANISTIIHELAHVSRSDLSEVDQAILARHFNGFATTVDEEAYARALERYVYDGMAMESELDGVFQKIAAWMKAVYTHVNQIGAHVHPEVKQVFDHLLVKPETPPEQLVRLLKEAPKIRKAQEAGYSAERGQRISDMFEQWPEEGNIDDFHAALTALKGELPKEPFTGLDEMAPESIASIVKSIRVSTKVRRFEKVRAVQAVLDAADGHVPTNSELALLNKIFDGEVSFKKAMLGRAERVFVEVFNIPRSIAASFDLSAPLRQGFVAGTRHPIIFAKAFKPMFQALASEERAAAIAEEIMQRENYVHYGRGKLAIETAAGNPDLAMREEQFYSSYAEKFIPPVKWSGRSYEAFLHRLRADIFDLTMESARAKKINVESDEFVEGLGKMVNQMTGRGVLVQTHLFPFETAAPLFNTFLFSPRLLASRVNMISPVYYFKLWKDDPFLFAEATKNLATTVLATGMVLAAASTIPGVSVGMDPTSANFGKIRIGDTRIDIMAGFGPLLVFLSREFMGKSTSSTTGKTQSLSGGFGKSTRKDILYRFLESKAAPTAGIGLDVLRGSTFIGDPVTVKGEIINSTAPMMLRDVLDVWREPKDPVDAALAATFALALGTFGVGFSSYGAKTKPSAPAKSKESDNPFESDGGSAENPFDGGGGAVENPFAP
jgi:hypothetical protein